MRKNSTYRKAMLLPMALLMVLPYAGAQEVTMASKSGNKPAFSTKGNRLVPLKEALAGIEAGYSVNINYDDQLVSGLEVPEKLARISHTDIVRQLSAVLNPVGLMYVRMSQSDYVIKSVKENGQSNSANKVSSVLAQEVIVTGVITNDKGEALPGVSVVEKGTKNGSTSDVDGKYRLRVSSSKATLVFRFIGYVAKEVPAGSGGQLNIRLESDTRELTGVVVTALGIKRQERALGYSIATLDGSKVNSVKEVNVANALSGKVAGVNVRSAGSDPGSTAFITIRGESSFSSTPKQPLLVVDGIPVDNGIRNPTQPLGSGVVDYGSPMSDINPDDVETVTVLKGASAAALYGSRAAYGVILITTKTGAKAKKGLGVSVNSSIMVDQAWIYPNFQNEFGAGDRAGSDETISESSWGPRLNIGTKHIQWDSPLDGNGNPIPTDWVAYPNRHKDFFKPGFTLTNNVAVTGNNDQGNFRLSYTNLTNEGIVPNTDLKRNTINLAAGYKLNKNVRISTNVSYIGNGSDNRPAVNRGSAANIVYTTTPNIDINKLKNYWLPGQVGVQQFSHVPGKVDNPYLIAYEATNGYNRDRIMGNVQLNIDITEALTLMLRTGLDHFSEQRETKRPFSLKSNPKGGYGFETSFFNEMNSDFLLTYKKAVSEDWFFSISGGASRMDRKTSGNSNFADALVVSGLYNISNAQAGTVRNYSGRSKKRINSVYGMGQVSYKNYIYLDLTARNDWTSSLPTGNNSYFYPSASLSAVLTDMFHVTSGPLSFAKLRLNWAQVGGDTDPYQLYNTYRFGQDWGVVKKAELDFTLKNNNLKPEIATSSEIGADLRFFSGRLGIDASYYIKNSRNQIMRIQTTMASGYGGRWINAGEIENKGWEVNLTGTPIKGAFNWDVSAVFSRNRNRVVKLTEGISSLEMNSAEGVKYLIREGEVMGDFYANTWEKVPDGPYKGEPLLDESGAYQKVNEVVKIGNYNPDFMVGFTNTFTYKGFTLNVLIDWRQGGQFYSYMAKNLLSDGRTTTTSAGRDPQSGGLAWNDGTRDRTDGMILHGYIADGNGGYKLNDVITDPENYYGEYYWSFNGRSTFDATYVKLREASLSYVFPNKMLGNVPVSNLTIGLIGRNLFNWTAAGMGYDPETAVAIQNGSFGQGVTSWSLPGVRSFGFKLGFNF
ncbi:SusC/RagA family TonB-linked outer membrane protein [Chitinophaga defluvii]|uniref:SusC/RagA family TonB-linked outer membrane protein n=1 Tax=Chitinophaga defluvii TaxID=3163343 RepID=A0ABV2T4Q1_9BACT